MPRLGTTVRVIISACAAAGLLVACNDGTSTSSGAFPGVGGGDSGGVGAAPVAGASPLFQVDACTMVPADVLAELDIDTEPRTHTFDADEAPDERGGNICSWHANSSYDFTVMVNEGSPGAGNDGQGTESTIDGRRAVRFRTPQSGSLSGSCKTDIVVEEHVEVVVQVEGGSDLDAMCALVDKALPSVSAAIPG